LNFDRLRLSLLTSPTRQKEMISVLADAIDVTDDAPYMRVLRGRSATEAQRQEK
jgi:hypothetical protein